MNLSLQYCCSGGKRDNSENFFPTKTGVRARSYFAWGGKRSAPFTPIASPATPDITLEHGQPNSPQQQQHTNQDRFPSSSGDI